MPRPDIRRILIVVASLFMVTLATRRAHAQRELLTPLGDKGTLSIDQLSGFRMSGVGAGAGGGVNYGISYAGIVGFAAQSVSQDTGIANQSETVHYTSFWIAPSADYFVIDHLSIGGLLEVATTGGSVDVPVGTSSTTASFSLPSATSVTILPRVGWMFGISDRFGIWPRLGLGYGSHSSVENSQNPNTAKTDTFSSFILDLDVGFLYRVNENWFLKGSPEITFAPGSVSTTTGNTTVSTGEHMLQFGVVGGIGVMWDLL